MQTVQTHIGMSTAIILPSHQTLWILLAEQTLNTLKISTEYDGKFTCSTAQIKV